MRATRSRGVPPEGSAFATRVDGRKNVHRAVKGHDESPMTLAFIREHEAAGNVADTFADIKTTMRISTVNLIWRHLATNPPALEYAWARARPLYDSPNLERSVARFGQALDDALPVLPRLPAAVLPALGITNVATLAATLDTYNRGNAYNLITLLALIEPPTTTAAGDAEGSDLFRRPCTPVPDVPELDELDENTRALVLALNTLGTDGDDGGIVATLYKHAAHWPGYLGLAWSQLAPLAATGDLQRAIRETEQIGRLAARSLAGDRHNVEAPDAVHAAATDAINRFVRYAISRMVPIGQILRQSLPA